jgi:hypothetical protein
MDGRWSFLSAGTAKDSEDEKDDYQAKSLDSPHASILTDDTEIEQPIPAQSEEPGQSTKSLRSNG